MTIDLEYTNPLHQKLGEAHGLTKEHKLPPELTPTIPFGKRLTLLRERLRKIGEKQDERENIILTQIQRKITDTIESYASLRNKDKVRVLMFLGSYHPRIFKDLQANGQEVSEDNLLPEEDYPFMLQAIQNLARGETVDRTMAARVIAEELLEYSLESFLETPDDLSLGRKYIKKVSSLLSPEDIKNLFDTNPNLPDDFLRILAQKEVSLPHSTKEMEMFLEESKN